MKRILVILAALVISGAIIYGTYQTSLRQAYLEEYYAVVQQLDLEREEIEDELLALREERINRNTTYVTILVEDLSESLWDDVFPLMQEYNVSGTMAISPDVYPGQTGCVTQKQMQTLLDAGWSVCAFWNGTKPLADALPEIGAVFQALDLEAPTALCVGNGFYEEKMDSTLRNAGYTTVIHHGEVRNIFPSSEGDSLRFLGAVPWNYFDVQTFLEHAMNAHEKMALSVDFSTLYGKFDARTFHNMLTALQGHDDNLQLVNLQDLLEVDAKMEAYYQAREAHLQAEIERCEQEIESVYALYEKYGAEMHTPQKRDTMQQT